MHLALADVKLMGTALLGGEMVSSGSSPWFARATGGGGWDPIGESWRELERVVCAQH